MRYGRLCVVLFTPDDIGYSCEQYRGSEISCEQNVLLELGFFLGTWGENEYVSYIKKTSRYLLTMPVFFMCRLMTRARGVYSSPVR